MCFPEHPLNAARWILPVPTLRHLASALFLAFAATPAAPAQTTKSAVLTVAYAVNPSRILYSKGDILTLDFTVTNSGPGPAENIMVQTKASNNMSLQPMQTACTGQPCIIGSLGKGQKAEFKFSASILAGGWVTAELDAMVSNPDIHVGAKPASATFRWLATSSPVAVQPVVPPVNPQPGPATQNGGKVPDPAGIKAPGPGAIPEPTPGAGSQNNDHPAIPVKPNDQVHASDPVLNLTAALITSGPYRPNEEVELLLMVHNGGSRYIPRIVISGTPNNLTLKPDADGCSAKPCSFDLKPGSQSFKIFGVINAAGLFRYTAQTISPESVSTSKDSRTYVSGIATSSPPNLWIWTASVLGLLGIAPLTVALRRAWWRGRITVTASLAAGASIDPGASLKSHDSLRIAALPIHVQASLARGPAPEPSQIPVLRKEILHD
jgi:uncharacterized repeat protein (TIGR01451 family)